MPPWYFYACSFSSPFLFSPCCIVASLSLSCHNLCRSRPGPFRHTGAQGKYHVKKKQPLPMQAKLVRAPWVAVTSFNKVNFFRQHHVCQLGLRNPPLSTKFLPGLFPPPSHQTSRLKLTSTPRSYLLRLISLHNNINQSPCLTVSSRLLATALWPSCPGSVPPAIAARSSRKCSKNPPEEAVTRHYSPTLIGNSPPTRQCSGWTCANNCCPLLPASPRMTPRRRSI